MSAPKEKWEVVGRGKGKKPAAGDGKKSKSTPTPTVMEMRDPLSATPTVFEGFNKQSGAIHHEQSLPRKPQLVTAGSGQDKKPKSHPSTKKPKPEKISLEDAMKQMDVDDFLNTVEASKGKFDSEPMIWLRQMAGHLQKEFVAVEEPEDPLFSDKTPGFPLLVADKELQDALQAEMSDLVPDIRIVFFSHCVTQMLSQLRTGGSVHGWRLLIQAISREQPDIVVRNMETIVPLVRPCANQPRHCLPLLWCCEHVPVYSVESRNFTVWENIYLPILRDRNVAGKVQQHSLDRLRVLVRTLAKQPRNCENIPPTLLHSMATLSASTADLSQAVRSQLTTIYPEVRRLFFLHPVSVENGAVRRLFRDVLPYLSAQSPKPFTEEMLFLLSRCIQYDERCLGDWVQMFRNHQKSSTLLVKHMCEYWALLRKKIRRNSVIETLKLFLSATAEQRIGSSQVSNTSREYQRFLNKLEDEEVSEEEEERKALQSWRGTFTYVFFLLFLLFAAAFVYDIYVHHSWEASETRHIFDMTGVLLVGDKLAGTYFHYADIYGSWIAKSLPALLSEVSREAEPYFTQLVSVVASTSAALQDGASVCQGWFVENFPGVGEQVQDWALIVWTGIGTLLMSIQEFCVSTYTSVAN